MKPAGATIPVVIIDLNDERQFDQLVSEYLQRNRLTSGKIGAISALEEWIQKRAADQLPIAFCMPESQGCKTYTAITAYSDEPVVFLSGSIRDIELLFGIDVTESSDPAPVSADSLQDRLMAIRERALQSRIGKISYAGIVLDIDARAASINGIDLRLSPAEFQLMCLFAKNPGQVFTRDRLLTATSGDRAEASDRSVDAHIKNLRKKLRNAHARSVEILTVYGVGYKLE